MAMKFLRKLMALMLVLAVIIASPLSAMAEETETPQNGSDRTPLEMRKLDPSTMNIPRIGELTDKDGRPEAPVIEEEDPEKTVRVSVVLEKNSTIDQGYSLNSITDDRGAVYYRSFLRRKQNELVAQIEAAIGRPLEVKRNLTLLVNAISCYVKVKEIPVIEEITGVRSVERENQYSSETDAGASPMTANTSYGVVGASNAWESGYTGAGLKIAIIDTGIDETHISFDEDAFEASVKEHDETFGTETDLLTEDEVQELAGYLNSQSANYISSKIPYAFNYVDGNEYTDHLGDKEGDHGSHVAGIAAANRYIYVGGELKDAVDEVYAVGMAPDAQIIVMKVFGVYGGAYDSDYMAAIEDAAVLGCDVANLSLGSTSQGFTYSNYYQSVFNDLADSDVNSTMVVTISAGNANALTEYLGRDLYIEDVSMHTGGSPGTYVNSLGVASADNIGETGMPLKFGDKNVFYLESDSGADKIISIAGTHEFVFIDALGTAEDYETVNSAVSLKGKVVIIRRGELTFVEKGNNLIPYEPAALIVANNQPGTTGMALDEYTGTFPMVSITEAAANYLRENYEEHQTDGITYYTGEVTVMDIVIQGQDYTRDEVKMSDFSSWGVAGSLLMKPEITAPGGNVYSVYGTALDKSGAILGGYDQYTMMSGTSMAAPHMAGLSALLAQYIDDTGIEVDGFSRRALVQSLLMSTATPMKDGDGYVSVLQQGAGLAEVSEAMSASSVIQMTDAALTTSTGADADGKVKVELGDDPDREGEYTYSFRVYNLIDDILFFQDPVTDVFTQDYYEVSEKEALEYEISPGYYMDRATVSAGSQVSYEWTPSELDPSVLNPYDFNMDGLTNGQDAQDLLDFLTGNIDEEGLDLEAGDADEDGKLTTYDAHLILLFSEDVMAGNYIPANGYADVTVTFSFSVDDDIYTNGAYIEGFTSLTEKTDTEGVKGVTHSIPILGFYGDWTDPSMFDSMSYNDLLRYFYCGAEDVREPYTYDEKGNYQFTNLMVTKQGGQYYMYSGNPYDVEAEFPYARLAINSSTSIEEFDYTLIRASATTGIVLSKIDGLQGDVTEVYTAVPTGYDEEAIWYDEEDRVWMNTDPRAVEVGFAPEDFGFKENDTFRIGLYAFPEYTGMWLNSYAGPLTDPDTAHLEAYDLYLLVQYGLIGEGSMIGYDLKVDDTAPEILEASLEGDILSVKISDNQNLAFVALTDVEGNEIYDSIIPAKPACEYSFDISEYKNDIKGYVAVFAGDYAANESAVAVKVNKNAVYQEISYWLTDTLKDGEKYLIADGYDTTENGRILSIYGNYTAGSEIVPIYNIGGEESPISVIAGVNVPENAVWTLTVTEQGQYIFTNSEGSLNLMMTEEGELILVSVGEPGIFSSDGDNLYVMTEEDPLYITCDGGCWTVTEEESSVYFYCEDVFEADLDPTVPWTLDLDPGRLDLYVGDEADIVPAITPITADQSIEWSSSDETVAVVDQKGHVYAVGEGHAEIYAVSHADHSVLDICEVDVFCLHEDIDAIIFDVNSEIHYAEFNTEDVSGWMNLHEEDLGAEIYGNMMYTPDDLYCVIMGSGGEGYLAYVDPDTYEPMVVSYNAYPAFDMAPGLLGDPYLDQVYVYAMYLIAGNVAPMDYDGVPYSGVASAALDVTGTDIGTYLAGVACKEMGTEKSSYYLLDMNGNIWATDLVYDADYDAAYFTDPVLVMKTGIACTYYYQSLYFDGEYLLWSCYNGGATSELYVIDAERKILYDAGGFGDGVWPVTGLFQFGTVAPGYEEIVMPGEDDGNGTVAPRESVLSKDDPALKELNSKILADLRAEARKRSGEEKAAGHLNAVTVDVTKETENVSAEAAGTETGDGTVKVEISEDEDSANGFVTVSYDPEKLTLKSAESSLDYNSIAVDEEKGTVKFAYADAVDLDAGTVLATLSFEPGCEDEELEIETSERGADTDLEESAEATVEGTGHEWGEPEVNWSKDHKKATFTFKCGKCDTEETLDAEVTSKKDGDKTVYTAKVTGPDGEEYTATYVSDVPETGTVRETVILAALSAVSVLAAVLLIVIRRKRRKEE